MQYSRMIGSTSSTPGLFDRKMLAVKKIMEIQSCGPDDNGIWEDGHNTILGHNRLAILELSELALSQWLITQEPGLFHITANYITISTLKKS